VWWLFDSFLKYVQANEARNEIEDEFLDFYVGHGVVLISGVASGCVWACRRTKCLSVPAAHCRAIIYLHILAIKVGSLLLWVVEVLLRILDAPDLLIYSAAGCSCK